MTKEWAMKGGVHGGLLLLICSAANQQFLGLPSREQLWNASSRHPETDLLQMASLCDSALSDPTPAGSSALKTLANKLWLLNILFCLWCWRWYCMPERPCQRQDQAGHTTWNTLLMAMLAG